MTSENDVPMTKNPERGPAAFALRNPHFVIVGCLIAAILGGLAVVTLPKDLLPASNQPAVQILSFYPGMPVEHVEKNLTRRFELYTGQAIGVEKQDSKSLVGVSVVRNFFNPGSDLNTAIAQTTSLVMSVLRRLPPGSQPPLILPFDPTATVPLALVAVSGDFPEKQLYDKARYEVRNTVQASPGAMAPTVMGGSERQVVIELDPDKLRSYNFSPLDVMQRLAHLNTFIPTGNLKLGNYDYQITSNGLVDRVKEMDGFPLRSENGVPVYLRDLGRATDGTKIQTNVVRIDGKRQVYVPVYRQPGANSIQIVDQVREAMKRLGDRLQGFSFRVVADQSAFIRHAIHSIAEEALIGGGLAALMVLFFLGDPRATAGVALSLPLSIFFAFIGLKASGQTINAMTLGGLALSIGVLVDNSIVVLENISRKLLERGAGARSAALAGAAEVAMPVLASTLATLIVFFPVAFLGGIVQVLFTALAKAVLFAMLGSYLAATTVIPLFAARFLKAHPAENARRGLLAGTERAVHRLSGAYRSLLAHALRRRAWVLASVALLLAAGASLAPRVGVELFPKSDAGSLVLKLRQKSGTRIEESERFAAQVERILRETIPPRDLAMIIANAGVYYGYPAAFTPNSGPQDVFFHIELAEDRERSSQDYARLLREKLPRELPGAEMGIELGGLMTSALNGGAPAPIDVQIAGPSLARSHEIAEALLPRVRALRGAVDARIQQRLDAPQISLEVDRKRAGELGLNTEEVVKNVVSAVAGSTTFDPSIWVDPANGIDYQMGVRLPEDKVSTLEQLRELPIRGRWQERTVPLRRIASVNHARGPSEINHVDLVPVVDLMLDAQGRDIGGLASDIERIVAETKLPEGYSVAIRGEISEMRRSIGKLAGGFALAAILVYLILVVQFRSFALPLVVMVTVPLGMAGIVAMLAATGTYFSIQAAIGAIFMIGIAVANGVLLIEFMARAANGAVDVDAAILDGAKARLRPILMTSLASILGLVPMALGLGHGSEANIPLGRSVIGGQLVSTTLTLFVVPILFRWVHRGRGRWASPPEDGKAMEAALEAEKAVVQERKGRVPA